MHEGPMRVQYFLYVLNLTYSYKTSPNRPNVRCVSAQRNATRVTAQALMRERSLCLAGAGPYANADRPVALLAQRVERIVSQESGAWADTQRDTGGGGGAGGDPSSDD